MPEKLTVSPGPHVSQHRSTRSIMLDVIIALLPAMIAAVWFFRSRAVIIILTAVISCSAVEYICNRIRKKQNTLGDFSAVLTGIILALSVPAAIPFWMVIVGSVVAVGIGKMAFGGLGANIFNPAMVGRAFMAASFSAMTVWTVPAAIDSQMPKMTAQQPSPVTQATPLAWAKEAIKGNADIQVAKSQLKNAFIGNIGGCLGETSAAALLLGGLYLLLRRTISPHIPFAVLIGVFIFAEGAYFLSDTAASPLFHVSTGGLLLCAFFIATDPVTMPLSAKGMWIFGLGVGILIMLIRVVGEFPEGVMYAVLIMNAISPLIDRMCKLVPAGGKPDGK